MRRQVVDTFGLIDHIPGQVNIKKQSITSRAHLKACVLYFTDLAVQCEYSIKVQCRLFHTIYLVFATKPTVLIINKIHNACLDDLVVGPGRRALIDGPEACIMSRSPVRPTQASLCDALLEKRVDTKLKGDKVSAILNL